MILKKLYNKLERMASKSGIITLFLLAHSVLLAMMILTFPRINAKFGTEAFDLKTFGYSQIEAVQMIQNLDQPTIDFYVFPQLFLLDLLYPILLALFLSVVIIRLSYLINIDSNRIYSNLFVLPFIAMFFDYLENIFIWQMITNLEVVSSNLIEVASLFAQMKGAVTSLSWIVILALLVIWLIKKLTNKKYSTNAEKSN